MTPARLEVTCAVLRRGEGLLLAQRRKSGLWELPGGKAEPGESLPACLAREMAEELDVRVRVGDLLASQEGLTPDGQPLRLHAFACNLASGEPRALEHRALVWLSPEGALDLALCPTDRLLLQRLKATGALDNSGDRW
ncbi:MAG: (deoxy)nucleoside triphosphate pyrophosphohydrolase [Desulfarculaceae bacterium]|nr:(deoxy)nucleoside triphosphate pyrophosphohydrolase [Desulfarculaceae bacterium]MCF8073372.1 (deoxy)nucleoside triphosphate pyrophosphohydrolase [Desulfarculaceae bacterium]MCF8103518.1 (deoxy)nucleoside triphosphate pyrophosphohydrolase [Desulfarculaceae bacterium]MCF8115783.1 (deoxy)nucleoside triphosphate pyrophosphohydrolase [Desulfarculaceae bacterium]